jgi:hypothetical protein
MILNADAYAEVIDRHVELAGGPAWLGSLLDQLRAARSSPVHRSAVQASRGASRPVKCSAAASADLS